MYRGNTTNWLKHFDFMLVDFILFQIAFLLSYMIRNGLRFPYEMEIYRITAIALALVDVCAGFFLESYEGILKRGYWREFRAVVNHVLVVTVAIISYLFITQTSDRFSRIVMIFFPVLSILLLFVGRTLWKFYLKRREVPESEKRSIILVGTSENYMNVANTFLDDPYMDFHVAGIGIVDRSVKKEKEYRNVPIMAGEDAILKVLRSDWVDEVFFDFPMETPQLKSLMEKCETMGITAHVKLPHFEHGDMNHMVEKIEGYTVITTSITIAYPRQLFLKRAMDIAGGLIGLILTGIIAVIIGPIIYVKSPGPIFFSQMRVGKNGRKFRIYKFRSMYMDAEERKKELMAQNNVKDGLMFKIDNDPRIIKGIGHFIRNYSLDEFPQFWNVLKGDMSLVGTRPPTVGEWEKYEYHHRSRLAIKPGMTGMWQVSGRSNITDFEEVVKLDRMYIQNWNIGQDIKILLKTVQTVLKRVGSM